MEGLIMGNSDHRSKRRRVVFDSKMLHAARAREMKRKNIVDVRCLDKEIPPLTLHAFPPRSVSKRNTFRLVPC